MTIKISEKQLDKLIESIIKESIAKPKPLFMLDEMTMETLLSETNDYSLITESYNWILKRSSWETNNYRRFLDIVKKTPPDKKGFLTWHSYKEITNGSWVVYTLKGHEVAFALHYLRNGLVDICNLVNNSDLKGVGKYVLQFAKQEGGTQMDNYRGVDAEGNDVNGKLGDLYRSQGFDRQKDLYKFDPQFQPEDDEWKFDIEKYGRPDIEGLERTKHRVKYGNPYGRYRKIFNDRMGKKFDRAEDEISK